MLAPRLDKAGRLEMSWRRRSFRLVVWFAVLTGFASIEPVSHVLKSARMDAAMPPTVGQALDGTAPFKRPDDITERQYLQIYEYFLREIAATPARRDKSWHPDYSSITAYRQSLVGHRENLRKMLGLVEAHAGKPEITRIETNEALHVEDVSIPLDQGFGVRALLFLPQSKRPQPAIIAIPPATETREQFVGVAEGMTPASWLTTLLRRGVAVSIPLMVERRGDCPLCMALRGIPPNFAPKDRRMILYRLGFIVGRTLVGLEVEQVMALRQFLASQAEIDADRISVLGEGQGGMTALYAAAVDERLRSATVVDYFQQRERCWTEPADRTLYGQLNEFGDAEVAALIAPRPLIVQRTPYSPVPDASALEELVRARRFYRGLGKSENLIAVQENSEEGLRTSALFTTDILGAKNENRGELTITFRAPQDRIEKARNEHFEGFHDYLRRLDEESDRVREVRWKLLSTAPADRAGRVKSLQKDLRDLMGVIPASNLPLNPRTSLIEETDKFAAYDVLLNVLPGVEAYGQLLVPRNIQGRAPAVICQHGIGGMPCSVTGIECDPKPQAYHEFATRLAERGYVTFAPYVAVPEGDDRRASPDLLDTLARLAAPLGKMRTSIELAKLHRIVDFLQSQPYVDAQHIGYYGLSYGGYSAIWMGPLEPRLKAVIISGYFNDWRAKITSQTNSKSFLFHPGEDMYNWNVLNRFTHVELIGAMWPRAVCIEFGEQDITTTPEWHGRAWAQVVDFARVWDASDRIVRDRFDGPHEIHGVLTFEFLDQWLRPYKSVSQGNKN
jgi:dienelactone hydrolase